MSFFLEMHVEILRSEIYNVRNLLSNSLDKNCVWGGWRDETIWQNVHFLF